LFRNGQVVKLTARVGFASGVLFLSKDANAAADGLSSSLVVSSDDNDTDTSSTATNNGVKYLLTGRVKHANDTNEGQVVLEADFSNKLVYNNKHKKKSVWILFGSKC
jgi:hypothetical protein